MNQSGVDKKAIEVVMNHVHIVDIFGDPDLCSNA